jgi:hypothetical protein
LHNVEHVEILPKRMQAVKELSSYHYAAVLHISHDCQQIGLKLQETDQVEWMDFLTQGLDRQTLSRHLHNSSDSSLVAIKNIPDSKIILERSILESLSSPSNQTRVSGGLQHIITLSTDLRC